MTTPELDIGEETGLGDADDAQLDAALEGVDTSALDAVADKAYGEYLRRLEEEITGGATATRESEDDEAEDPAEKAQLLADILAGVLGEKALLAFEGDGDGDGRDDDTLESLLEAWNPDHHPRGKNGRFIPKGSAEAVSAAKDAIGAAKGKQHTPESARDLLSHLNILTVKQLKELQAEHGFKVDARLRDELVSRISGALQGAGPPASAKAAKQPANTHPAATMRNVVAEALASKLGDKAEAVARDIGVSMNRHGIANDIAKHTGMKPEEAAALVPIVTSAMAEHLKANGIEPPDKSIWSSEPARPLTDEERNELNRVAEENRKKQKAATRDFAESNYKNPPDPETVTSEEWVALRLRQRLEDKRKDFAKLDKWYKRFREVEDSFGKDPAYYDKMRALDNEMQSPSLKRLQNKYRPSWMKKGSNVSLTAAHDWARDRLSDDETSFKDGYFSKYGDDNVKAHAEHLDAVKKAMEDPKRTLPDKVVDDVQYEDWLPKRYKDRSITKSQLYHHGEYMKKEHNYGKGLLNKAMEQAATRLAPILEKAKEFPPEIASARQAHAEAQKKADGAHARLQAASDKWHASNFSPETQAEFESADKAYNAAIDEQYNKEQAAKQAAREHGQKWLAPLLPNANNDRVTIPDAPHLDDTGRGELAKANEFLRRAVGDHWQPTPIRAEPIPGGGWRAYHSGDMMAVRPNEDAATYIHEYGHHLESQNGDTLGVISKAFAMSQLEKSNQSPKHLGSSYEPHEVGEQDEFLLAYSGKFYNHDASEVLSMGVQHLYEDPVNFYEKSPEHFKYTLAALHGHLT